MEILNSKDVFQLFYLTHSRSVHWNPIEWVLGVVNGQLLLAPHYTHPSQRMSCASVCCKCVGENASFAVGASAPVVVVLAEEVQVVAVVDAQGVPLGPKSVG